MNAIKNLLAAAAFTVAAGAASAAGLDIRFEQTTGIALTTSDSSDYLSGAMHYVDNSGRSFEAFCIELAQGHATTAAGFQSYTAGSFTGTQASLLQGLFSSSYAGVGTAVEKAAFQTAIWEITHEQSGVLDANAGSFSFYWLREDSTAEEDAAFLSLTSTYLQAAQSYTGAPQYVLTKLASPQFQDLVTVSAVPEPETYAMLLAGLGVIGFVARRRQRG